MNILVFQQFYTNSKEAGISRFSIFADEWAKQGIKTTIISGSINYMAGEKKRNSAFKLFWKEIEEDNITVIRVYASSVGYRTFIGRVFSYITFIFSAFIAGMFVEKHDVVIASSPPIFIGFVAYAVSFFRRSKFVFEVRDPWPDVAVALGYVKSKTIISFINSIARLFYRKAKLIIVNSPGLKEYLIGKKGISENKIGIVLNPVTTTPLNSKKIAEEMRTEMNWNNKFVVIYSGAMSAVYDFDTILNVAKKLSKYPKILFVFVGDGRQKSHIIERVKNEKIANVLLLPSVSYQKVKWLIASADIGIAVLKDLSTLKHVYSTKTFDYMSAGKPVVLAMKGVNADLICRDANAGICLNPGDSHGIEMAILELSNNPNKLDKLGKNGYEFAAKNLSARKLSTDYINLLKPIVVPQRKSN